MASFSSFSSLIFPPLFASLFHPGTHIPHHFRFDMTFLFFECMYSSVSSCSNKTSYFFEQKNTICVNAIGFGPMGKRSRESRWWIFWGTVFRQACCSSSNCLTAARKSSIGSVLGALGRRSNTGNGELTTSSSSGSSFLGGSLAGGGAKGRGVLIRPSSSTPKCSILAASSTSSSRPLSEGWKTVPLTIGGTEAGAEDKLVVAAGGLGGM